jgi:hypothetical protein
VIILNEIYGMEVKIVGLIDNTGANPANLDLSV